MGYTLAKITERAIVAGMLASLESDEAETLASIADDHNARMAALLWGDAVEAAATCGEWDDEAQMALAAMWATVQIFPDLADLYTTIAREIVRISLDDPIIYELATI